MATAMEHAFGGVVVGDLGGSVEGVKEDVGSVPEMMWFKRKESTTHRMEWR